MFGLGFVLSFGYWTTNFVEVQRAMASKSMSAARRTPIIGAFPKMLIPFIVIIPGMIAAVTVSERQGQAGCKDGGTAEAASPTTTRCLLLMRDLLPNGMLGIAIAGLLASFMAGMAANLSSFNTVFTYDIWQTYIKKDKPDGYYLSIGRLVTVGRHGPRDRHRVHRVELAATSWTTCRTLFSFFNAPLFATFILGMFWKRMTAAPRAGSVWCSGTASRDHASWASSQPACSDLPGQGASFIGAGAAFVVDIVVSVAVTWHPAEAGRRAGRAGLLADARRKRASIDDTGEDAGWYRKPALLAGIVLDPDHRC